MQWTVKQVAELAGITVRTLHHYDEIGLLNPAKGEHNGYRIYRDEDLDRLHQILFFRELGFELREIKLILDSPGYNRHAALVQHRDLLRQKRDRLDRIIESIDQTVQQIERKETMDRNKMFEPFDESKIEAQIAKYRDEAIERWGKDTVEDSEARVRSLSKPDMDAINAETTDINQTLASLMDSHPADSAATQEQVERWYTLLNRYFGEYTPEMFRGLGDLYVDDERFAAHYDAVRPGLARYLRDAMHAFADRRKNHVD